MIIRIDLNKMNNKTVILAKSKDSVVCINSKKTNYNFTSFSKQVVEITQKWPNKMIGTACDGLIVKVVIIENRNKRKHYLYNDFPSNILELLNLIKEVANNE